MALFSKKTTVKAESKTKPAAKEVKKAKSEVVVAQRVVETSSKKTGKGLSLDQILMSPHVTEKASDLSERGVYAFNVNKLANKSQVAQAVMVAFKVTPVKVAIVNQKAKVARNPRTNRVEVKRAGSKKALVYLKKGDKIEFV